MSAKHQTILINDPEAFSKRLPTIVLSNGTAVSAFDDGNLVLGFTPVGDSENSLFKHVPAAGDDGDYILAKRPCTLLYSGALFRAANTYRGVLLITVGDSTNHYGQVSPTFYSTGIPAPELEDLFDVAGMVTLDAGEAFSFLLDNASVGSTFLTMTITSVTPE